MFVYGGGCALVGVSERSTVKSVSVVAADIKPPYTSNVSPLVLGRRKAPSGYSSVTV